MTEQVQEVPRKTRPIREILDDPTLTLSPGARQHLEFLASGSGPDYFAALPDHSPQETSSAGPQNQSEDNTPPEGSD